MTLLEKYLNSDYRLTYEDNEEYFNLSLDEKLYIDVKLSEALAKSPKNQIIDPFLDNVNQYDPENTFRNFKHQIGVAEKSPLGFKFNSFEKLVKYIKEFQLDDEQSIQHKKYYSLSDYDKKLVWVKMKKCYDRLESEKGFV